MRKLIKIKDTKAWKSDPKRRKMIIQEGYRPLLLTDGNAVYWDGVTAIRKGAETWKHCVRLNHGNRELRIMAKEGMFQEAVDAIIHFGSWWELRDVLDGYYSRRFGYARCIQTGEQRYSQFGIQPLIKRD